MKGMSTTRVANRSLKNRFVLYLEEKMLVLYWPDKERTLFYIFNFPISYMSDLNWFIFSITPNDYVNH